MSTGNLPDPGKAQDFVKKLAQVLDDDERIRDQLETLVSPSCSCKQAEVCVVSIDVSLPGHSVVPSNLIAVTAFCFYCNQYSNEYLKWKVLTLESR